MSKGKPANPVMSAWLQGGMATRETGKPHFPIDWTQVKPPLSEIRQKMQINSIHYTKDPTLQTKDIVADDDLHSLGL